MASSTSAASPTPLTREQVVPSRKRIKLPPWLEVAKPRLIPLLLLSVSISDHGNFVCRVF